MLDDLGHLNLRDGETIVPHGILELYWREGSIAIAVHRFEHNPQSAKSIGTTLSAQVNDLLLDLGKI